MGAEDKDFKPKNIVPDPSGASGADALADVDAAKRRAAKPQTDLSDQNLARAKREGWKKS